MPWPDFKRSLFRSILARHWQIIVAVLFIIAAILRFWDLGGHSLWYDELATWRYSATGTLSEFFKTFEARDQNPVGYFLFSWLLTHLGLIGDSEVSLRAISAISGVLAVVAVFFVARKTFGLFAALVATAFLTFHYHAVVLSQEARPYSLIVLLAILHVGAAFRFLDDDRALRRNGLVALLTGTAMAYSHAYGLFFLFFFGVASLIFNEKKLAIWKRWIVLYATTFVLFLPGLARTIEVAASRTRSFSGAPDLNDLVDNCYFLFGHSRLTAVFFLVAMVLPFARRAPLPKEIKILLVSIVSTYVFAYVGSFFNPSFLEMRYLAVFIGPVALIVGWLGAKILDGRSRFAAALLAIGLIDVSQMLWRRHYYDEPKNEQNREAIAQALEWSTPQSPIVFVVVHNDEVIARYYPKRFGLPDDRVIAWLPSSNDDDLSLLTAKDVALVAQDEAWKETAIHALEKNYEKIEDVRLYRAGVSHWRRKN